jgi:hypothetical protein
MSSSSALRSTAARLDSRTKNTDALWVALTAAVSPARPRGTSGSIRLDSVSKMSRFSCVSSSSSSCTSTAMPPLSMRRTGSAEVSSRNSLIASRRSSSCVELMSRSRSRAPVDCRDPPPVAVARKPLKRDMLAYARGGGTAEGGGGGSLLWGGVWWEAGKQRVCPAPIHRGLHRRLERRGEAASPMRETGIWRHQGRRRFAPGAVPLDILLVPRRPADGRKHGDGCGSCTQPRRPAHSFAVRKHPRH